jgi:alkylation response protein AidB-like acyl-CoA dehydrogenase
VVGVTTGIGAGVGPMTYLPHEYNHSRLSGASGAVGSVKGPATGSVAFIRRRRFGALADYERVYREG